MKKTLVTLVTFFTVGIAVSFANNKTDVDPKIVSAFQKEFSFAQNVKWGINGEFVQVNFSLNDQGFVAWYNSQAELISTARNILYMQLPLSVIKSLEQDYANANISGIVEFSRDGETFYQITAEKKGRKFFLKATPSGNIIVTKKSK
jgi:hypothetical protein